LLVLLALAMITPEVANLEGKAAEARAIGYPLASFTVPILWYFFWRDRPFPWLVDLMVTVTCFTDILGNRLNLYDTIDWFDDWMHFQNNGILAGAFVLLTLHHQASFWRTVERALAFGAPAAIIWELAEYWAFLRFSAERQFGYVDTLGDLAQGLTGTVVAAVVIWLCWQRGRLIGCGIVRDTPARVEADRSLTS
jgi:hypothetical protein